MTRMWLQSGSSCHKASKKKFKHLCNCKPCKERKAKERRNNEEKEYLKKLGGGENFFDPENIPKLKKIEEKINAMQVPKKWT